MTDPFLGGAEEAEALRSEIRRLQAENKRHTVDKALLQSRLKSQPPSSEAAPSAASAKTAKPAKDMSEETAKLKEDNNKLKKDALTLQAERDQAVAGKKRSDELLEAVGVAACEREQRLRVVAAQIMGELENAKAALQAEQLKCMELTALASRAPAPPAVTAPLATPQPPPQQVIVVQKEGLPPQEVKKAFDSMRRAMKELEAKYLKGDGYNNTDGDSDTETSVAADQRQKSSTAGSRKGPSATNGGRSSTSTVETTPAGAILQNGGEAVKKRGRPAGSTAPSVAAGGDGTQSDHGSTTAPVKGGRRIEQSAKKTLQDNIAARAAAAIAEQRRDAAQARLASAPSSSRSGGSDTISFTDAPFDDAYTLIANIPPARRQQHLETLSRNLYQHFNKDNAKIAQHLVAYVASSAPKWTTITLANQDQCTELEGVCAHVREVERRAATYFDLVDRCGGDALVLLWARDTVARLSEIMQDADGVVAADQSTQVSPMTTVLRVISECRASKQKVGGSAASRGGSTISQLPTIALYWCTVHYLQTSRRYPDRRLLDESWAPSATRHPLVSAALHLFCSGATTLCEVAAAAAQHDDDEAGGLVHGAFDLADMATMTACVSHPAAPTLASLVLQAVVVELLVRHHVPSHIIRVIASAAGWSCRCLPLKTLQSICVRAALKPSSSASSSLSEAQDAIYGLRLLIALDGLSVLDDVTREWGQLQTKKPRGSTSGGGDPSADGALALLLSFVVVDFGVVDPRDEEWIRTASYLQDYLTAQQQQAPADGRGGAAAAQPKGVGAEVLNAAVSLWYMSLNAPATSASSGPATPLLGSGTASTVGTPSAVEEAASLEGCWSCAAKWWTAMGKKRRGAPGSVLTATDEASGSLLFRRLEELFSAIRNA